jgi:hypothetical protein
MDSLHAFKCKRFRNTTLQYLEYHCKALFETPCIANGSHIETMDSLHAFKCKRFRNTTQQYLEYHYKALFGTPCIANGSHIEP